MIENFKIFTGDSATVQPQVKAYLEGHPKAVVLSHALATTTVLEAIPSEPPPTTKKTTAKKSTPTPPANPTPIHHHIVSITVGLQL